jgi:hypothetical protein
MDTDHFWSLVEESRKGFRSDPVEGNMDRQLEALDSSLSLLSSEKVLEFRNIMDELLVKAFTWELWGTAYLVGERCCSEDWFLYFRAWLISMGRHVFEQAVASPNSLADSVFGSSIEDVFFEQFLYVANDVLERMIGEIPKARREWPDAPGGNEWQTETDLRLTLPNLWRRAQEMGEVRGAGDQMNSFSRSEPIGAIYKVEALMDGHPVVFVGSATDLKRRLASSLQKSDAVIAHADAKVSMKKVYAHLAVACSRRKTLRSATSEALRSAEGKAIFALKR